MKIIGAIMEVNPFHNGHKYFLSKIPKNDGDILIVVTSTSIVQRGEITCLNKHDKAQLLLTNGADIVVSLPSVLANQGGLYFAKHAIAILNTFSFTDLYFGSESADLQLLNAFEQTTTSNFKGGIHKENLDSLKSNDILGISYLQAIKDSNLDIDVHLIKRIANNYNDQKITSNIASATSIRENLHNPKLIKTTLPKTSLNAVQNIDEQLLFNLFKINLSNCLDNNIPILLSENNQLLNKLAKVLLTNNDINSIPELVALARDKNNSKYKLQRVIINTILMVKADVDLTIDFNHILGFSKLGQQHIKAMKEIHANINYVTTLKNEHSELALIEKRATNLYNTVTNQNTKHDYLPPKIKS